ncbi:MAG: hypothetical protein NUV67_00495 [archaeon]|nr:hypothetical protein [archaeon]
MQQEIDRLTDSCIRFITLGTNMPIADIDKFQEIIQAEARKKKFDLHSKLESPSALLNAAFELHLIKQQAQLGFVERHGLLIRIQSSLMALAHTDPAGFREVKTLWLDKPFAEREAFLKDHATFASITPKLLEAHTKKNSLLMELHTVSGNKAGAIKRRLRRLEADMIHMREQIESVIKTELGAATRHAKQTTANARHLPKKEPKIPPRRRR